MVMHFFQNVSLFVTESFHNDQWVKLLYCVALCLYLYGMGAGGRGAVLVVGGVCVCACVCEAKLFYEQLQESAVILFKLCDCAQWFILFVNLYKLPEDIVIYDGRNLFQESIYQSKGSVQNIHFWSISNISKGHESTISKMFIIL